MSIVPSGVPAFVRTNDHTSYGGHTQKADYQGQGTVNPRTDVAAKQLCRMAADLAAVQRTAPFATMTYTCVDTGGGAPAIPTINSYQAMAGGAPTPTRNGDGDANFAFASSYADDYSISGNLHITGVDATVHGSAAATAVVALSDSNADGRIDTVRVKALSDTGGAIVNAKVTLTLYSGPL